MNSHNLKCRNPISLFTSRFNPIFAILSRIFQHELCWIDHLASNQTIDRVFWWILMTEMTLWTSRNAVSGFNPHPNPDIGRSYSMSFLIRLSIFVSNASKYRPMTSNYLERHLIGAWSAPPRDATVNQMSWRRDGLHKPPCRFLPGAQLVTR